MGVRSRGAKAGLPAAEWIPLDTLKGWERNPRKNRPEMGVAHSIARFGWGAPIVARSANREIIAGHTRANAAAYLIDHVHDDGGWRDRTEEDGPFTVPGAPGPGLVPVRLLNLSESEAHALALADNRLGELAEWDDEALTQALRELSIEDVDLSGLGWDDDALRDLLAPPPSTSPPPYVPAAQLPNGVAVLVGRCEDHLRILPENSVDSCVCDPPYGLSDPPNAADVLRDWMAGKEYRHPRPGFMGHEWDAFVPGPLMWLELFRVLKPGAHVVAFAGSRTVDWLTLALRLAGFEIRDAGAWAYWSGFPKSTDVSKAIDAHFGVERVATGVVYSVPSGHSFAGSVHGANSKPVQFHETTGGSEQARAFDGWGTALKPALEPWVLARKPLDGTIVENVLKWGTGGLNIDGCRFTPGDPMWPGPNDENGVRTRTTGADPSHGPAVGGFADGSLRQAFTRGVGARFPANLIVCSKPGRVEREAGCDHLPLNVAPAVAHAGEGANALASRAGAGRASPGLRNAHPTLKPIRLMAWLTRLVTPPGGTVLDPFAGSGSVGCAAVPQGFGYIGIEIDPVHARVAEARIAHWSGAGLSALPNADSDDGDDEEATNARE